MAVNKLEHRPNDNAISTNFGWQDKTTGELLVSAVGAFANPEAIVDRPNIPITTTAATPKAGKVKQEASKENSPKE